MVLYGTVDLKKGRPSNDIISQKQSTFSSNCQKWRAEEKIRDSKHKGNMTHPCQLEDGRVGAAHMRRKVGDLKELSEAPIDSKQGNGDVSPTTAGD